MNRSYIRCKIMFALIAALLTAPAAAAGFHDGGRLKEWADAYDRTLTGEKPRSTDNQEVSTFMGYLAGVNDALSGTLLCTPSGVKIHQLVVIVKKYVREHPEMQNRPASHSVIDALSRAFPCKPRK